MNCSKHRERLHSYVSGRLPENERLEITLHLKHCRECSQQLAEIRSEADFFKRHKATPPPPPDLTYDIMASIDLNRYKKPKQSSLFDMANWGFSMVAAGLLIFILNFTPLASNLASAGGQFASDNGLEKKLITPFTNIYNSANSAVSNIDKLNGITIRMEKAIKGGM